MGLFLQIRKECELRALDIEKLCAICKIGTYRDERYYQNLAEGGDENAFRALCLIKAHKFYETEEGKKGKAPNDAEIMKGWVIPDKEPPPDYYLNRQKEVIRGKIISFIGQGAETVGVISSTFAHYGDFLVDSVIESMAIRQEIIIEGDFMRRGSRKYATGYQWPEKAVSG